MALATNLDNDNDMTPLSLHLTNRISPEIYDTVIDYLHSFKPTLLSCSTVCKAWLPACRYHLFNNVNFTPTLTESLSSSPDAAKRVLPYVRNVGIGGACMAEQRDDFDKIIALLLSLESVRGLALEALSWDFLSEKSAGMLLKADSSLSRNVIRLCLQYTRFPSFSVLAAFIGGFTVLEELRCDNVTWELPGFSTTPLSYKRLTKLYICSSPVGPILNWLIGDAKSIPIIHILVLPDVPLAEIPTVGSTLRQLGPSLRHLEVGFLIDGLKSLEDMIDLFHNTDLRTLHIHNLTLYCFPGYMPTKSNPLTVSPDSSPHEHWLVPFLATISSHRLIEIVLHIWLTEEHHLDLVNWSTLSTLLNESQFVGIKTLRFHVSGLGEGRGDVKGWLLARLRAWQAASHAIQVSFS